MNTKPKIVPSSLDLTRVLTSCLKKMIEKWSKQIPGKQAQTIPREIYAVWLFKPRKTLKTKNFMRHWHLRKVYSNFSFSDFLIPFNHLCGCFIRNFFFFFFFWHFSSWTNVTWFLSTTFEFNQSLAKYLSYITRSLSVGRFSFVLVWA